MTLLVLARVDNIQDLRERPRPVLWRGSTTRRGGGNEEGRFCDERFCTCWSWCELKKYCRVARRRSWSCFTRTVTAAASAVSVVESAVRRFRRAREGQRKHRRRQWNGR